MASSQVVPTSAPQPAYADLSRRLAAYFIDVLIAASVIFIASFTLRGLRAVGIWQLPAQVISPDVMWRGLGVAPKLAFVVGFVLSMGAIYLPLFESSSWQASFGKRLLDIHVTDDAGTRIGVARAFGRWFTKLLFNWFLLWAVSLGTIAGTKEKKAIHDFVVGTLVVRGRPAAGGSLEPWRIAAGFGIPFLWLVGTFLAVL